LWQILVVNAPERYYLSAKACQGILNRAKKRGKKLPEMLEEALLEVVNLAGGVLPRRELSESVGFTGDPAV
jgi:hypothetical protein